ncbi:MAG: monofunctional biosynthetic peptidoglycan transglycosylase [Chitinispirillaceae bacterium]|nr:monofunctional biosynthetic peptidoglycan transglycosylase [Chitinispirillaceae bacterium]
MIKGIKSSHVRKVFRIIEKSLRIFSYIILSLLIAYSILFSIVGTVLLYKGINLIKKPIKEVIYYQENNPDKTKFMENCIKELLIDSLEPDTLLHVFIPLDSISPFLKDAVIAAEDDAFYLHPGIDINAVIAATEINRIQGRNSHGGSTITQQLAKNLFLSSERTFGRKIKELFYALLLEWYLGKERILELYLNYAQWGRNIFGCEAASQFYFKKSCKNLSKNEAVRLAAVLAKPSTLTPLNTKSLLLSKRIGMIAQNLYLRRSISDSEYFFLTGTLPPSRQEKDSSNSEDKYKISLPRIDRQNF